MINQSGTTPSRPLNDPAGASGAARSLVSFFVLAYAVSWTCWFAAVGFSHEAQMSLPAAGMLRSTLLLVGTFGPALAALLLTSRVEGQRGLHVLLARMLHGRVDLRWYLFAILYMPAIKLAVALTHRFASGVWPRFGHEGPILIVVAILLSLPVQSGEELGWRGYALPRLAHRLGWPFASLLLGAVWGLWHLPLFFLPGADKYGQSFLVYVVGTIAFSVAITWVYARTHGSLLLTMLMHSAFDQTIGIVSDVLAPGEKPFALGASLPFILTIAFMWIVAAYLLVRMRTLVSPRLRVV
jgi:CAAX protease family protein